MVAAGYAYDLLRKLGASRFQARTGELLVRPVTVVAILLGALVLSRLGAKVARRSVPSLQLRGALRTARAEQRAGTMAAVLASLWRGLVWTVAVLLALGELGLDLAPLLAGAGIAGVAIGFGAQSLVKDFLSGLFILVEDQYGVGDSVNLGEAIGVVEEVNLRVTRLRAVDGTVWYVPNGEIRRVGNQSMEWSRAVVDVLVPWTVDVGSVRTALLAELQAFAADPAWAEQLLDPPEVWGVEATSADGLTLRIAARTVPKRQWEVARGLRERVHHRLAAEGVGAPGRPLVVEATRGDGDGVTT